MSIESETLSSLSLKKQVQHYIKNWHYHQELTNQMTELLKKLSREQAIFE
jgi:hypothetical protein